jgi:hypothetical protein
MFESYMCSYLEEKKSDAVAIVRGDSGVECVQRK